MSQVKRARQTAANAVARAMSGDSKFSGPREPTRPLGRNELLSGGEYPRWSAVTDAVARLMLLPLEHLSERCRRAVEKAIADPTYKRIRRARAVLFAESCREDLPETYTKPCAVAHELLAFNLASLGCRQAHAEISAAALERFNQLLGTGQYEEAFLCLRTAIVWAGNAAIDFTDVTYYSEPNFSQLAQFKFNTRKLGIFAQAVRDAEAQILLQDDLLKGGAGQIVPPADDGAFSFDLDGLEASGSPTEPDLPEIDVLTRLTPLSMRVFPLMPHLPEPSKMSRDRLDSPRALAEPWAGKPMPLVPAPDPRAFVEALLARFPWAAEAIETFAADLVGAPFARFTPRILVGPAGCGKTAFARGVFEGSCLDVTVYSAAGQIDGGSFAGTSRQWGTWRASPAAQACLRFGKANHGMVIDEVEKAGDSRRWGRLDETILPFLERGSTAKAIHDPAFECALDLSAVSYILTANSLDGLSSPLRDRCQVLHWPAPRAQDLPIVAASILDGIRQERGLDEAWCPALDGDELDALSVWRGGSLRPLRRMIETVLASREQFAPRH
jgi:hypothetical protein